ncbi:MAG: hypothetical protein ACOCWY_00620 [Thermodesulfobacteriota bacterium]
MKSSPLTIEEVLAHSRVRPLLAEGDVEQMDNCKVAPTGESVLVGLRDALFRPLDRREINP